LRHFCDLKSKHSIEQAIADPARASQHTVNHLYATIFDRILKTDPQAYRVAAQTFRLMMCLYEVMSPTALLAAASITRDRAQCSIELPDLLRTCFHLVILDDELDTLQFAHASVQEYLSRLPEFSMTNANSTAAWSCLVRCIDSPLPDLTAGIQPARDFDVYAAMYWPLHYNAAGEHDRHNYLEDALKDFIFSEEDIMPPFPSWIETVDEIVKLLPGPHTRLTDISAVKSDSATPLFTACIYGFEFAIEILSKTGSFNVNQRSSSGHTGLYLASAAGQVGVADRLLALGADAVIEGGRHTTPLQAACAKGHGDIVQLLLGSSHNFTPEAITSAVQTALRSGHEDVAVVLLKNSTSSMSQDIFDQVFEAAAGMGFAELMNYLHQRSKPLAVKKRLATRGAEKTFHDSKIERFRSYFKNKALPDDAVATAAFYGQNEIIRFCLGKGLDIEYEGPFGSPLRAASLMGQDSTVRMLLDLDANIDAIGSFGDALQAAAMKGHISVAKTLLHYGVDLENSGGYYGNAIQAASYRGHIQVVGALLTAGASIGQKGLFADAVSAAVSAGNQDIVALLIQSGYQSPYFRNKDEVMRATSLHSKMRTPSRVDLLARLDTTYHYAGVREADRATASQGRDIRFEEAYNSVYDRIEANDFTELSDIEHQERYGSHALLVATATGQEPVVQMMLDYRFAIGVSLHDIGTVLQAASAAGHFGIVDYILSLSEAPRKDVPRSLERAA
jgi:ankyrin repeat protein